MTDVFTNNLKNTDQAYAETVMCLFQALEYNRKMYSIALDREDAYNDRSDAKWMEIASLESAIKKIQANGLEIGLFYNKTHKKISFVFPEGSAIFTGDFSRFNLEHFKFVKSETESADYIIYYVMKRIFLRNPVEIIEDEKKKAEYDANELKKAQKRAQLVQVWQGRDAEYEDHKKEVEAKLFVLAENYLLGVNIRSADEAEKHIKLFLEEKIIGWRGSDSRLIFDSDKWQMKQNVKSLFLDKVNARS